MKSKLDYSGGILILGYVFLVGGVLGWLQDVVTRTDFIVPFDLGFTVANSGFLALGLVAILVGKGLAKLEERLCRLEKGQ